jgi:hypothetical protein
LEIIMSFFSTTAPHRSKAISLLGIFLLSIVLQISTETPAQAEIAGSNREEEFSKQYTALTSKVILAGVELERFSLKYRRASTEQPKFRRLRFTLAQEAGAAGSLAFEVTALKQFNEGRNHPLQINPSALHAALATALVGSVIAGSGSSLELASNAALAYKNKRRGFDPRAANRFVVAHVKALDALLNEHDALVAAHTDSPAYERAVAEGKMLRQIRNASLAEYATFHSDVKGYATFTNLFFFLNALTNSLAATGLGVAYKAIDTPKYNAPTNIIFIATGAVVMAVPIISSAAGKYMKEHAYHSFAKQVGETPHFEMKEFDAARQHLEVLSAAGTGTLIPALPAMTRLAYYSNSSQRFKKQIIDETTVARHLEQVALESTLLGPLIGGTLMTQGIFGTVGYYKFTFKPRRQLNYALRGAIAGTPGAALAVGGTAAWYVAGLAYEYRLKKEHRMPSQIIDERLKHLDEIEALAKSL